MEHKKRVMPMASIELVSCEPAGKDMRLTPVSCSDDHDVEKTIKFYMGSNTPERREYIMENLICDSSDF